ncbi:ABC transporter permease [Streptomyces sp. DSM 44917]|uniref:ABC transporter permease n=1 Tax=Streptomyces boetiae TaxID=3075541 RepID=A0ABU2LBQ1_9ACTN|nr:ABC transporter permease [Streptomyces sp. DSM 44917]MDT0308925.1 ABC transporter permease [Streptomyces sp. DSM 44917]
MRGLLRAEWTKLRTVAGPWWLLLGLVAGTLAAGAAAVAAVDVGQCPAPDACHEDTARLALGGVRLGQVAAVVLGVLMLGGEHGTGLIGATLVVTPRRGRVLAAKALVLAGAVGAAGAAAVAGSLWVGRVVLPGNGFTPEHGYPALSLADGAVLRAAVGSVLYLVLVALLGLGAGAALRDTAGGVTAGLGVLLCAPVVGQVVSDPAWRERLEEVAPMPAGLAVQATVGLERLAVGPWAGLGVLACWAAGALALGGAVLLRRDV